MRKKKENLFWFFLFFFFASSGELREGSKRGSDLCRRCAAVCVYSHLIHEKIAGMMRKIHLPDASVSLLFIAHIAIILKYLLLTFWLNPQVCAAIGFWGDGRGLFWEEIDLVL